MYDKSTVKLSETARYIRIVILFVFSYFTFLGNKSKKVPCVIIPKPYFGS